MATVVDDPVPKQGAFEKQTEFAPSPGQKAARRKESLLALGFLGPQLVGLVVFMLARERWGHASPVELLTQAKTRESQLARWWGRRPTERG
jgi:hypothetical protein